MTISRRNMKFMFRKKKQINNVNDVKFYSPNPKTGKGVSGKGP